jgi:hypothetical protein
MIERLEGPRHIEGDNLISNANTVLNRRKNRLEMKVGKYARGVGGMAVG